MKAGEGGVQSFVISGQASKACRPAKRALHDPASWQEHKAALGFGEFDDLQSYALGGGLLGGVLSGVAWVDEGKKGTARHEAARKVRMAILQKSLMERTFGANWHR